MSNVDSNVTLTKKKRKKRRKRSPPIIPSQPIVSPVNTIAALFKLHQKFTNKSTSNQSSISNKKEENTNKKRKRLRKRNPPMIPFQPIVSAVNTIAATFRAPQSTHQQTKSVSPSIKENSNTTVSYESSEPGPSQTISDDNKTENPEKLKFQANKSYNQKFYQNDKFDDCEIYDSPTSINFESDDGMTDLNDDDICNKNLGTNVISDKININKPDNQISFETKLQQQHAKKLESRNQVDTKSKQNEEITEEPKTELSAPALVHRSANQELIEALSSDINTAVRDKLKTTPCDQNKYNFNKQQIQLQASPESQKRVSAFQQLGPIQHKESKLTINLGMNEEQTVRTKKKRKKRRKRNPPIIPSQPIVSPVNTIAALFKLQQKLTNKSTSNESSISNKKEENTNKKRKRLRKRNPPIIPSQPIVSPVNTIAATFRALQSSHQQTKSVSPNIKENSNTTVSYESSEPDPSQTISDDNKTENPEKLKFQANKSYNQKFYQNDKFDDCEIYDSPTSINFESNEGMTNLNDDDICNKNLGTNVISDKININKPDNQISFETKLQQQHAKKLESRNQVDTKSKQNEITEEPKTELSAPALVHISANQELIEALSSDINTAVRDKLKTTPCDQNKYHLNEQQTQLPGVPKIFMQNSNMGAIQPQGYVKANTPTSVTNDKPIFVQTDNPMMPQVYSPTDIYTETQASPESQKRVSAFQQLGPIQHKESKLTINLGMNEEQTVR